VHDCRFVRRTISEVRMCPVLCAHFSHFALTSQVSIHLPLLSHSWSYLAGQPFVNSYVCFTVLRPFTPSNNSFSVQLGWTLHLPSLWGNFASQARCRWENPLDSCMWPFTPISLSILKYLQCVPFHRIGTSTSIGL
jgi:hypothetical protein